MNNKEASNFRFRKADEHDIDVLWTLIEPDLSLVPTSWPKYKEHFLKWLLNDESSSIASKFVVEVEGEIGAIVSVDFIDERNIDNYQMSTIGDANVSYMTLPRHAGNGIASFALNKVSEILEQEKVNPLLRIAIWNKASSKVAEKCGFTKCDAQVVVQDFFDEEPTILNVYRRIKI